MRVTFKEVTRNIDNLTRGAAWEKELEYYTRDREDQARGVPREAVLLEDKYMPRYDEEKRAANSDE